MPRVTDVLNPPLSGAWHIDALLNKGPAWNYLTGNPGNTIYYSFALAGYAMPDNEDVPGSVEEFTAAQQDMTRFAMNYVSAVTGIDFVEGDSATAQVHFANGDILGERVTAECLWGSSYTTDGGSDVTSYVPEAIIYMDNAEWRADNADLTPGGAGYDTLLHELGHMLGLKHPFEGTRTLPEDYDHTANTLMSYTSAGGPYYLYGEFDMAALKWLYGGDGLAGSYGVNSVDGGVWLMGTWEDDVLTGTSGGDVLEGAGGEDSLDGGAGLDWAIVAGLRANFQIKASNGAYLVGSGAATDSRLAGIERLLFDDATVALDIDGTGGQAYRLYRAAFDRTPDQEGLGFWIRALDNGQSLTGAAAEFIGSKEFATLYGSNDPANDLFVKLLYQNVLHRAPDQSGLNFWVDGLNNGASKAEVLMGFSESAENKAALIGTIGNGFVYEPYLV